MSNQQSNDPGLGKNYESGVKRIMNADGSYNITRIGGVSGVRDIFKYLIELNSWKFISLFTVLYVLTNLFFASLYYFIDPDGISGVKDSLHPFLSAFYFSTQTFTTVGYGRLAPISDSISMIASIEAFIGLIAFSILTGLIYGRFSRPSTKIEFSNNLLISPYENISALMFKMVNKRDNVLLNAKVEVILSLKVESEDHRSFLRDYNNLKLETSFVRFFPLTWTIVHPIDENSPLKNLTDKEIKALEPELIVLVEAFDETFSKTVYKRHSYIFDEWIPNARFKKSFYAHQDGTVHLDVNAINDFERL